MAGGGGLARTRCQEEDLSALDGWQVEEDLPELDGRMRTYQN